MTSTPWRTTEELCRELTTSRSTLSRWRRRGLLTSGHHWVRKNPTCPRSDLLWHRHRCSVLLRSNASPACSAIPKPDPSEASDDVLLPEAEIQGKNSNSKVWAGFKPQPATNP